MLVRTATTDDAPLIGEILADGLTDKYGPAYGRRAEEAIAAIAAEDASSTPDRADGYLVADSDGVVAGVAFLGTNGRQASVGRPLLAALGPIRALRAAIVLTAFAKGETAQDEAVIDELAVASSHRRRGVASALIAECALRGRAANHRRLTLWVTGDNHSARALYEREGFRIVERRRWPSGRVLFGARGALKMERALLDAS